MVITIDAYLKVESIANFREKVRLTIMRRVNHCGRDKSCFLFESDYLSQ